MTRKRIDPKLPLRSDRQISAAEIARFLKSLAAIYRNPKLGNPALSEALWKLAACLLSTGSTSEGARAFSRENAPPISAGARQFQALEPDEIRGLLSDEKMSKVDLIELASARFSIPRAKLTRMRTEEVRETIRAALLHEDSIKILSQEAQRGGENRSS